MSLGLIQLLSVPLALPHNCAICGYSNSGDSADRQYVDFGLSVDYYGAVYFCTCCMVNVAQTLGFITPKKAEELYDQLDSANLTTNKLEAELANYRQFEQLVLAFRPGDSATSVLEETDPVSTGTVEDKGSAITGTEEPSSEQGSSFIPDAADNSSLGSLTI